MAGGRRVAHALSPSARPFPSLNVGARRGELQNSSVLTGLALRSFVHTRDRVVLPVSNRCRAQAATLSWTQFLRGRATEPSPSARCHGVPCRAHGVSRGVRDEPTEMEYALRTAADAAIAAAAGESFSAANRIESNRSIDRIDRSIARRRGGGIVWSGEEERTRETLFRWREERDPSSRRASRHTSTDSEAAVARLST